MVTAMGGTIHVRSTLYTAEIRYSITNPSSFMEQFTSIQGLSLRSDLLHLGWLCSLLYPVECSRNDVLQDPEFETINVLWFLPSSSWNAASRPPQHKEAQPMERETQLSQSRWAPDS